MTHFAVLATSRPSGSNAVRQLLDQGWNVTCNDRIVGPVLSVRCTEEERDRALSAIRVVDPGAQPLVTK